MPDRKYSMLARLTPDQQQLLTDEETQILKFGDWFSNKMELEPPSFSSARIGLQMLEVAICRMEDGNRIDDFMADPHPTKELLEVWKLYQAYCDQTRTVDEIIAELKTFNNRYVAVFVRMFGFPEEMLRQTGVAELRRKVTNP